MIVATPIVERHNILVARLAMPQVQIAVGIVVSVGLTVPRASEPPWSAIHSCPCALVVVFRVHGVSSATTTAVGGASDIDDPVWSPERPCRSQEGLPVASGLRCPELGTSSARNSLQSDTSVRSM